MSDPSVNAADSHPLRLDGIRVLMLTVGHDVTDQRVYGKMAHSLVEMGAAVTIAGMRMYHRPADVDVIELPTCKSTALRTAVQPWRCLWRARRVPADIVHFHDPELLLALPIARLLWPRAKFIYDVHEDIAQLIKVREWLPPFFRQAASLIVAAVEKTLARLAHGVIGVTPPLTDKFSHRRRITAYNFVTRDYFESSQQYLQPACEREYHVAHLGALRMRRAEFLAEILTEFHRRRPGTRSIVFGCPPNMLDRLRQMVPPECEIQGWLSHTEIPRILGNSRIGLDVHPWPEPHLDVALPVKVCEYMACECGVVCSSMPVLDGLCSSSPPSALKIIHGGQPSDYAERVIEMSDAIENGQLSTSENREYAFHRMNWDHEAEQVARLYLDLYGSRRRQDQRGGPRQSV
jgi:hypothetical protein